MNSTPFSHGPLVFARDFVCDFNFILGAFLCELFSELSQPKLTFDNDWFGSGFGKHYTCTMIVAFRVQSKWTATGHKRNEILERLSTVRSFFIVYMFIVNRIVRMYL